MDGLIGSDFASIPREKGYHRAWSKSGAWRVQVATEAVTSVAVPKPVDGHNFGLRCTHTLAVWWQCLTNLLLASMPMFPSQLHSSSSLMIYQNTDLALCITIRNQSKSQFVLFTKWTGSIKCRSCWDGPETSLINRSYHILYRIAGAMCCRSLGIGSLGEKTQKLTAHHQVTCYRAYQLPMPYISSLLPTTTSMAASSQQHKWRQYCQFLTYLSKNILWIQFTTLPNVSSGWQHLQHGDGEGYLAHPDLCLEVCTAWLEALRQP